MIAELCVTGVQFWIVRRQLEISRFFKAALRYFWLGLPMFAVGLLTSRALPLNFFGMAGLIAEGVLVYAGTLLLVKDDFVKDLLNGKIL